MTYSTLFQHKAAVSASFTPLSDEPNLIPGKRGILALNLGILQTQITPAEARKLAADLMTAAQQYEAHFSLPIQSEKCAECGGGSFDGHRDACLYRPEPQYQESTSAIDASAK